MGRNRLRFLVLLLGCAALTITPANAACINRFLSRSEAPKQVITLLTGKLTFQEAQTLAASIKAGKAEPLAWVDVGGRTIAKQFGELKVVRPMPVSCEGHASGVVMICSFVTSVTPAGKIQIRLDPETLVEFEQQKN